jgi:hypothetical protein
MGRKAALLALVALLAGCGYKSGYLVREDVNKVAVPIFANDTFYRNIEIGLTQAVVNRIEKETPYELADSSIADAILEGRITSYRFTVLAENKNNQTTQAEVTVTVEVTLRNARNGAVLAKNTIREGDSFSIFADQTQAGTTAFVFRRAAQRIVEKSFEREW